MSNCEACGQPGKLVFSLVPGRRHVCVSCSHTEQRANTKRGVLVSYLVGSVIVGAFVVYVVLRIFALVDSGPR